MHINYHLSEWDLSASVVSDVNPKLSVDIFKRRDFEEKWKPAEINWSAYGSIAPIMAIEYSLLLEMAYRVATQFNSSKIMKYRYTLRREDMDPYVGIALAVAEYVVLEQVKKTNCELIGEIENLGAVN